MSELDQRIRDVLGKLATLSEVSAVSMEPRTSQSAPESSPPPGFVDRPSSGPPRKDDDLHGFYRWHFQHVTDTGRRLTLLLLAERDWMTRVYHVPHAQNIRSGGLPSSEDESAARVVEWYEGVPVLEVAILEYCSPGWVEKARRRLGRKPEDGRPISPFLRADEDERHRMVAQHAARGWGAKKIADRLGVAKGTVQRYMPEREMAA